MNFIQKLKDKKKRFYKIYVDNLRKKNISYSRLGESLLFQTFLSILLIIIGFILLITLIVILIV